MVAGAAARDHHPSNGLYSQTSFSAALAFVSCQTSSLTLRPAALHAFGEMALLYCASKCQLLATIVKLGVLLEMIFAESVVEA